ncbi:methyl-accepting chemotaxis protein [Ferrimonas senticii]|uniref:methyl-accepting chemotaxis protein n=1 Tax=Ferrimonas senticii TaxID=394566 RepID=UPI0004170A16|nr:PAS domain-containing methyl-accepting chemotaxis protein [Ferrimonas senticii]
MQQAHSVTPQQREYPADAILLSTTDPNGVIKFANPDFAEICGYSVKELQGSPHNIVRHPDMPALAFRMMWQTIQQGKPWIGIVKNRCANGDHYWVHAYVNPVKEDGQIHEYQSVRRRPLPQHVERADKLYQAINQGKTPRAITPTKLGFCGRLITAASIGAFATMLLNTWLPLWGGMAGVLFSAALMAWLLQPLMGLVARSRTVIDDPLATAVYTGRRDELGQLEMALTFLSSEMTGVMGRVADSAVSLNQLSEQLSDTVKSSLALAENASGQSATAAAAVEEMSVSFTEVANNAGSVASALQQSQASAAKGSEVLAKVTQSIEALSDEVEQLATAVSTIERDSAAVAQVLDVIRAITEQTNLLALNAAIEAARAGESGRGFAVVADEVRSLAKRTADSTVEIETIISQFQLASRQASEAMSAGASTAKATVSLTSEADAAFAELRQALDHINAMSIATAAAMSQQQTVAAEISNAVQEVHKMAEQNQQETELMVNKGQNMSRLATKQAELSQQFWQVGVERASD